MMRDENGNKLDPTRRLKKLWRDLGTGTSLKTWARKSVEGKKWLERKKS